MKKILVFVTAITFSIGSYAQKGFGFDVGIGSSKAPMIAVKYFVDKNAGSIGLSYQIFNDALGKKEGSVLANSKAIGDGTYFYTVDFGYTRVLSEKLSASADISVGRQMPFQNLIDTVSSVTYHKTLPPGPKSKVGGGVYVIYTANNLLDIFGGYNSIRKATIGVGLRFLH